MTRGSYYSGFAPRDGQPRFPELWRGCVGAWAPCLGQSGLSLRDWSGFRNNGTLGMTAASGWQSRFGQSVLRFNGSTDYVSVPDAPWLSPTVSVGGAAWVYLNSVTGIQSFYRKGWTVSTNFQYTFRANGTAIQAVVSNASGTIATASTTTTIATGTPYFAAWAYDGANVSIWLNGKLEAQTALTGAIFSSTQPLVIGASYDTNLSSYTHFLNGDLDAIFVHNRPLNTREAILFARSRSTAFDMEFQRRYTEQAAAAARARMLMLLGVGR